MDAIMSEIKRLKKTVDEDPEATLETIKYHKKTRLHIIAGSRRISPATFIASRVKIC